MQTIDIQDALSRKFPEWVGLLITRDTNNKTGANLMPVGWIMCCSFQPPMLAVAVGLTRHTHALLTQSSHFVLAFAGADQTELVQQTGAFTGKDIDKFQKFNIPFEKGAKTQLPILTQAAVNFECEIDGTLRAGDHTIFAARILAAYVPDQPVAKLENFGGGKMAPAKPA